MRTFTDPETSTDPSLINSHLHASYSSGAAHSTTNGLGGHSSPVSRVHPALPHGYGPATPAQNEAHIDPELRSHEPTNSTIYPPPPPNMMPSAVSQPPEQAIAMTGPAGHASMGYADGGEIGPDGRKAKRELSQSKRAAQNRAAQVRGFSLLLRRSSFLSMAWYESRATPKNAGEYGPSAGSSAFSRVQLVSWSSLRALKVPQVGRRLIIAFASRERSSWAVASAKYRPRLVPPLRPGQQLIPRYHFS